MVFMPLILGIAAGGFHRHKCTESVGCSCFCGDHVLIFIKRMKRKKDYGYLKAAGLIGGIAVLFIYIHCSLSTGSYISSGNGAIRSDNQLFFNDQRREEYHNDIVAILLFSIAGGGIAYLNTHEWTLGITVHNPEEFTFILSARHW